MGISIYLIYWNLLHFSPISQSVKIPIIESGQFRSEDLWMTTHTFESCVEAIIQAYAIIRPAGIYYKS